MSSSWLRLTKEYKNHTPGPPLIPCGQHFGKPSGNRKLNTRALETVPLRGHLPILGTIWHLVDLFGFSSAFEKGSTRLVWFIVEGKYPWLVRSSKPNSLP